MSDKDDKNSQDSQSPKSIQTKKQGSSRYIFFGLISFLAFLLAGAAIGFGYYAWLELNKRLDQAAVDRQSITHDIATIDENVKLQSFKKQVKNNVETVDQKLDEQSKQIKQQASMQERLRKSVQETIAHVNRSQLGWGLKEAEHLLRMANHRLRIERDVAGAIMALNAASSRLHELKDERLIPVRESISKQVGKLKNFPYPDWVGISLQLDNVLAGLRQKLIKDVKHQHNEPERNQTNAANNDEQNSGWTKLIEDIKNSVINSVKITREEQKIKLFISQQEKQRDYEFLRIKLLGAKYAVTSRDDESYHRELEAAIAWLENTDTINNSNELIDELQELSTINLEPELPDITEANTLLLETMEDIENS